MATRNVVLTDAQSEMIDRLVASGRYQNASEAMRAGLRLLEREEVEAEALRTRLSLSLEEARRGELAEIAEWTLGTFGPRQAEASEEDRIARCGEIASGRAHTQDCRRLIDPDLPEDLRFARCGQHFIVFVETDAQVTIIDFLHNRTDLPRQLSGLSENDRGPTPLGGGGCRCRLRMRPQSFRPVSRRPRLSASGASVLCLRG